MGSVARSCSATSYWELDLAYCATIDLGQHELLGNYGHFQASVRRFRDGKKVDERVGYWS
jgi:hypothetical protein